MTSRARCVAALLLATSCTASLPSAKVVANMSGGDFAPVAANAGFVVTGNPLTAWRAEQLQSHRSVREHPGAIAVSHDGSACATVAAGPGLGLRSYRLPDLEQIGAVDDACNDLLSIAQNGAILACAERHVEEAKVQTFIKTFTFPELEPVESWGPLVESIESMSFVGAKDDRLAVATTFVEPPYRIDDYRSRIYLFDTRSGKVVTDYLQNGRFPQLAFTLQGDVFVWAGQAGAQAWSVRSHARLKTFRATTHTIAVAVSPDARLLATSHGEYAIGERLTEGGGTIQIFDLQSGERLAGVGSAQLRMAASPPEGDRMLTERPEVDVRFELLGAATTEGGRPVFGDMFGSAEHVANHRSLAFLDNDTLLSAGRGFFALWTLNQAAIRKARSNR